MTKKKPHKRKKSPRRKKSNINKINKFLLILLITLTATITSYFLLLKDNSIIENSQTKVEKKDDIESILLEYKKSIKTMKVDKFEEYNEHLEKEYIPEEVFTQIEKKLEDKNTEEILKKTDPLGINEIITKEYNKQKELNEIKKDKAPKIETNEEKIFTKIKESKAVEQQKNLKEKKKESIISSKPKLAIVIDDVTIQSQINTINNIGYTINIALMPPTKGHKDSAKIAQNLPFSIVHFPLQASVSHFEEEKTLKVGDSYKKIEKRVAEVRKLYPNAKYTNNHTGSVFTAHKESMDHFIKALSKYNFQFIDSRTTSKSVAKDITKKYNMPYIARNIFLDNKKDFNYIQSQLKKAIKIAKKNGSAIAIGHPYPITMKVLKESKSLLKDLDLVYINKIPVN